MPKALILLAEGAEEMETVITADILVRGGVDVTIAGLHGKNVVKCSRNVLIQPHAALSDVAGQVFDAVILPGGLGGSKALAESAEVKKILQKHEADGKIVAAICAAPTALKAHGIGKGKKVTSYPSVKDQLAGDYKYEEDRVVVDGKLVTSRGPGTSAEFGLKLVELLVGADKAHGLVEPMLLKC